MVYITQMAETKITQYIADLKTVRDKASFFGIRGGNKKEKKKKIYFRTVDLHKKFCLPMEIH